MLKKVLVVCCTLLAFDSAVQSFHFSETSMILSTDAFARGGRRGGGGSRGRRSYGGYRSSYSGSSYVAPSSSSLPNIEALQKALSEQGFYKGAIDGKMGSQTRMALRQFQSQNGLKDDGVAGVQTLSKLGIM